jgi:hypothetical protein
VNSPLESAPASEDHTAAAPDRPIFIVGCPRSGTTLLSLMVHAHPHIAIPPETRHLLELFERHAEFGDLRQPENRLAVADHILGHRRFKDLKLDRAQVRAAIEQGPPTIGSAIGIVLREYSARFGKSRWGDKRPLYINHLSTIFEMFPDAQIVHIIRDGRACVASLKRMPWWDGGSISAMSRWVQAMYIGSRAKATLRPDQYHEISYEKLVTDPRPHLEALCAFLGEPFDEAMLEPKEVADAFPKRKKHHANTRGEVTQAPVAAWQHELEEWEVAVFEVVARKWLLRHGYALVSSPRKAPPQALARAVFNVVRRRASVARQQQQERRIARSATVPLAAQLTSGQRRLAAQRGELRDSQPSAQG